VCQGAGQVFLRRSPSCGVEHIGGSAVNAGSSLASLANPARQDGPIFFPLTVKDKTEVIFVKGQGLVAGGASLEINGN